MSKRFLTRLGVIAAVSLLSYGAVRAAAGDTVSWHMGNDLYIAGQSVTIDQEVKGDVYVAGNSVTINVPVAGDVFAAASSLTVNKAIGGSLRAAAQNMNINAAVGHTATVAGSTVNVNAGEGATAVMNNLVAAGATVNVSQPVKGYFMAAASDLGLNSSVTGESRITSNKISLASGVTFAGPVTVTYPTGSEPSYMTSLRGASKGGLTANAKDMGSSAIPNTTWRSSLLGSVSVAFFFVVFGLLVLSINGHYLNELVEYQRQRPFATLLLGLVAIPGIIVASMICGMTVVLIPLAVFMLMMVPFAFLAGIAGVYTNLGDRLLRTSKASSKWLSLIVGGVVIAILLTIPFVDVIAGIIVILLALGSWLSSLLSRWGVMAPVAQ